MSEKRAIKRAGIVVKQNHDEALRTANELTDWLTKTGIDPTCGPCNEATAPQLFDPTVDLVVVLGGDGTMISTARMSRRELSWT